MVQVADALLTTHASLLLNRLGDEYVMQVEGLILSFINEVNETKLDLGSNFQKL